MNVIHCLNEKEKAHLQYIPLKKGDILFHENIYNFLNKILIQYKYILM